MCPAISAGIEAPITTVKIANFGRGVIDGNSPNGSIVLVVLSTESPRPSLTLTTFIFADFLQHEPFFIVNTQLSVLIGRVEMACRRRVAFFEFPSTKSFSTGVRLHVSRRRHNPTPARGVGFVDRLLVGFQQGLSPRVSNAPRSVIYRVEAFAPLDSSPPGASSYGTVYIWDVPTIGCRIETARVAMNKMSASTRLTAHSRCRIGRAIWP